MKKSSIGWLFAVITLAVLLAVSVILGVTGYFSSVTYLASPSDLVVGDNVSIAVKENESSVASFTFDGGYLPNETIPHVIQINGGLLNKDVKVRVKAEIFGLNEKTAFDFVTTSHFEKAEDGYYYYDETLPIGSKITFSNYCIIPENNFQSGEKYILTVVVETIDAEKSGEIWQN